MAMASDDINLRIERLNTDNYRHWHLRVKGILIGRKCWKAIDPGFDDELTEEQTEIDQRAQSIILTTVDNNALDDIAECSTAREMWTTLHETYNKCDLWHGMLALKEYSRTELQEDETMSKYLARRSELLHKVKSAGVELSERQAAVHTLMGLPPQYESLARSMKWDDDHFSFQHFKKQLLEEERRLKNTYAQNLGEGTRALTSRRIPRSRDEAIQPRGGHAEQHKMKETKHYENKQRPNYPRCYRCNEHGHIGKFCPKYGDHKVAGENQSYEIRRQERAHRNMVLMTRDNATSIGAKRPQLTGKRAEIDTTEGNNWILDSGATNHMTDKRDRFDTFVEKDSIVEVAGGGTLTSKGYGTVKIRVGRKCGDCDITLTKVLWVPHLKGNLLSLTKLAEKGCVFTLSESGAHITTPDDNIVLTAYRKNDLYYLSESDERECKEYVNKAVSEEKELWHKRMGHVHYEAINMPREPGRNEPSENTTTIKCDTCARAKITATHRPKQRQSETQEPLELIHSDVMGPINPISKGGARYVVTFLDDYTRYCEVKPISGKHEVLKAFDTYRRKVETRHGKRIKAFRSDNGGEYVSAEFNEYLRKAGIDRQLTAPYTPSQNGAAERLNRTLAEMTRCLLIESGMPTSFWGEAISTATYIRNRCPSKANKGETPYERWNGRPARVGHMRIFGCRAWVKKHNNKGKFAPRGEPVIFIGYSNCAKAYRFWNPSTGEVQESVDAIFDEEVFPERLRQRGFERHCDKGIIELDWSELRVGNCGNMEIEQDNGTNTDDRGIDCYPENPAEEPTTQDPSGRQGEPTNPQDEDDDNLERDDTSIIGDIERDHSYALPLETNPKAGKNATETRTRRTVRQPTWMKDYVLGDTTYECSYANMKHLGSDEPHSFDEAIAGPEGKDWKEAIIEELENLLRNNTWEFLTRPKHKRILRTKWVFKRKFDEDGNICRYRARLVVLGNQQRPQIDYGETYSPTVKMKTIRILMALAVEREWEIHHIDVVTAYLMAELAEEAYIEVPDGLLGNIDILKKRFGGMPVKRDIEDSNTVCRLRKSMYGLHQAGRAWNTTLDGFFGQLELRRSDADPCVYLSKTEELIVSVYVDDILAFGRQPAINRLKDRISARFQTRDLGRAKHVLSMKLTKIGDRLHLSQTHYSQKLLEEFGMNESRPVHTPLVPNEKSHKGEDSDKLNGESAARYRKVVGSLLYLSTGTRPDLAFAASYLSQFNQSPTERHWLQAKHVLRYLSGTKELGLEFQQTGMPLSFYTDADWGSNSTDRKSFSGYVAILAGTAVSWACRKQRCTALSTVEAELVALSEGTREFLWIKHLMTEMDLDVYVESPITIYLDNQGAKKIAENGGSSERTKHIDLKTLFVREEIANGNAKLEYVRSELNLADSLTKSVGRCVLERHLPRLGVKDQGGC